MEILEYIFEYKTLLAFNPIILDVSIFIHKNRYRSDINLNFFANGRSSKNSLCIDAISNLQRCNRETTPSHWPG